MLCPLFYPFQHVYSTTQHFYLIRPLYHHRYADDIQIFISFAPKTFIITLSQIQDAISNIWTWMTSNTFSLNPSKTEFMLIGPLQHISKIDTHSLSFPSNHSISPTYSSHNLDFIFDSSLICSKIYHRYPVLANIMFATFAASGNSRPQNSICCRYFSCTYCCKSLYIYLLHKQISRLQLLQNFLARAVAGTPELNI